MDRARTHTRDVVVANGSIPLVPDFVLRCFSDKFLCWYGK